MRSASYFMRWVIYFMRLVVRSWSANIGPQIVGQQIVADSQCGVWQAGEEE